MDRPQRPWWRVWDRSPATPGAPPTLDESERERLVRHLVRRSGRERAPSESPFSRPLSEPEREEIAERVVDETYGGARELYDRAHELHEQGRYEELEELHDASWAFRSSASTAMLVLVRMNAAVLAAEASLLKKNRREWDRAIEAQKPKRAERRTRGKETIEPAEITSSES
jgi:hypothetical protein